MALMTPTVSAQMMVWLSYMKLLESWDPLVQSLLLKPCVSLPLVSRCPTVTSKKPPCWTGETSELGEEDWSWSPKSQFISRCRPNGKGSTTPSPLPNNSSTGMMLGSSFKIGSWGHIIPVILGSHFEWNPSYEWILSEQSDHSGLEHPKQNQRQYHTISLSNRLSV